jgi:hypothetical protein
VLNFEVPSGLLDGAYREGGELNNYAEFAAERIVRRDPNGAWCIWNGSSYENPLAGINNYVYDIQEAPNGDIYVCGKFMNAGGISNADKIAVWSKEAQTWNGLGVNITTESIYIYCMAFDANGDLYVGGNFVNLAGVSGANYIAKFTVATGTWRAVGTGINSNVWAIEISPEGVIYIGGDFTSAGGNSNCKRIAYFDGTNWAPLSTGLNERVEALKFAPDGKLLIGGQFLNADGTNGDYICWWDGTAFRSFTDLGAIELNDIVASIDINPGGTIIIGGNFSNAGGDDRADGIAAWRGNNWGSLWAGGVSGGHPLFIVNKVDCLSNGDIYASGSFTRAGDIIVNGVAKSVKGAWQRLDIELPFIIDPVYAVCEASDGTLYIGGGFSTAYVSQNAIAAGNVDLNVSSGSANTYPRITIIGPGKLYSITNYSTGAHVEFNDLTLLPGETLRFNFDPLGLDFNSSWAGRGSVLRYVNPGSDYGNFYLKPGNNAISLFMDKESTTEDTVAWITWTPKFWGIDGALLE